MAKPFPVNKCNCPICHKEYGTVPGAVRHLQKKHQELTEEQFLAEKKKIKSVQFECNKCGWVGSNVSKHRPKCPGEKAKQQQDEKAIIDAPTMFHPQGLHLLKQFDTYIPKTGLRESTQKLYRRELKLILKFFEETIHGFKADSLLFPLENHVMFPSLTGLTNLFICLIFDLNIVL